MIHPKENATNNKKLYTELRSTVSHFAKSPVRNRVNFVVVLTEHGILPACHSDRGWRPASQSRNSFDLRSFSSKTTKPCGCCLQNSTTTGVTRIPMATFRPSGAGLAITFLPHEPRGSVGNQYYEQSSPQYATRYRQK
jgi:hypothetical protein